PAGAAAEDADVWALNSVLFHSCGIARAGSCSDGFLRRLRSALLCQDGLQVLGRLSRHAKDRARPSGGDVLHAHDVYGIDFRHDLIALWPVAWNHYARAVLPL